MGNYFTDFLNEISSVNNDGIMKDCSGIVRDSGMTATAASSHYMYIVIH